MKGNENDLTIKPLNIDMIAPKTDKKTWEKGGSKIVIIGKPGSGKSHIIKSLMYQKKHIIPVGLAMSGTEDMNQAFCKIMPSSFVFNGYNEEKIKKAIRRQKYAKFHVKNPWALLILDDCTDDETIFNTPTQKALFKNGRHWNMFYILSLQYAMDIKPAIRTSIDGIFLLREPIYSNRKKIWENYASIIPTFNIFCKILDFITNDYTCLYIDNSSKTNDWRDCIYWYRAPSDLPKKWTFGCDEYWYHHEHRYDPDYVDTDLY